jgi:hypothetical protein
MAKETDSELKAFVDEWTDTAEKNKEVFLRLKEYLSKKDSVTLEFIARPGLTYSLRGVHANQKKKDLFVMVDVIEDSPRWLSVCFYGEMITDPEERGDFVPEGLLGEDAVCFDIEEKDEDLIQYVEARIGEACQTASKE